MPIPFEPGTAPILEARDEKVFNIKWFSANIEPLPVPNSPGVFSGDIVIKVRAMSADGSLHPSSVECFTIPGEVLSTAVSGENPACPKTAQMMTLMPEASQELIEYLTTLQ